MVDTDELLAASRGLLGVVARSLTAALEHVTAVALDALDTTPAYARIDVTGDASNHQLIELELIEPELFFRFDPTVADRLARHVLNSTR